jgi:peroxiredoxin
MVAVNSTMLPLGTPAPDFALPQPDGTLYRLETDADAKALLVVFMCNHCPFVVHVAEELARLGAELPGRGVAMIGISANNVAKYPADSPEKMVETAAQYGWTFPYLYDEDQSVAKAYRAACTPDFYLFDGDRKLAYRGQLDDSRPGNGVPVTGADLRAAVDAVLAGAPVAQPQVPSIGCNIKWIPGGEPDYFG